MRKTYKHWRAKFGRGGGRGSTRPKAVLGVF